MWRPYDKSTTVGQRGSEGGIILRDEEHDLGARVTLEQHCTNGVPVAVTCGVYGWFFHTRFLSNKDEAEFPVMLDDLASILHAIPDVNDSDGDAKTAAVTELIQKFVDRFP